MLQASRAAGRVPELAVLAKFLLVFSGFNLKLKFSTPGADRSPSENLFQEGQTVLGVARA